MAWSTRVAVVMLAAAAACAPEPTSTPQKTASRALHELFDWDWELNLTKHPAFASSVGDLRYNAKWGDHGLASYEEWQAHRIEARARLARIDRTALDPADRLDYDLFARELDVAIAEHGFRLWLRPMTQLEGIQTAHELADEIPFDEPRRFDEWAARIAGMSKYVDDTIDVMRQGIREKIVHPKVVMARIPAQLEKQLVANPKDSPFYEPFKKIPDTFTAAQKAEVARSEAFAREHIASSLVPAFRKLQRFFADEYLPACTDAVGAWQLPRGDQAYRHLARARTTTDLSPERIHELGLSEVARIRAQMDDVKKKAGFSGSMDEFFKFLRTDPRFYFKTSDELLAAYRELSKRIDPKLPLVIGTLPRTPYGVEPVPDVAAPDTFAAYYRDPSDDGKRPGTYFVNLYKPETRPKWEMTALSLHESVPGHHTQIALALEHKALPKFRTHADYTAYVEGWALYAESLGDEMGLYEDPYARFGKLTYEMWRAVRLVVDTGMHLYKWDRDKAVQYFLANAAKQEHDVVNEVDRYIVWPGQALAYKVGELRIQAMRARAAQARGKSFDRRAFHDAILAKGPMPIDVLERRIDAWIAGKAEPPARD